jgi:hypothetical protein
VSHPDAGLRNGRLQAVDVTLGIDHERYVTVVHEVASVAQLGCVDHDDVHDDPSGKERTPPASQARWGRFRTSATARSAAAKKMIPVSTSAAGTPEPSASARAALAA